MRGLPTTFNSGLLMKKILILPLVTLLGFSSLVHAQAYKCKQPDGSTAFQDRPCAAGASGSKVDLTPAQGYSSNDTGGSASAGAGRQDTVDSANEKVDAANARIDAENRRTRCQRAQNDLGVLKEERPIYHYDKDGNKVYIEDAARPAAIAAAQQRVAAACN